MMDISLSSFAVGLGLLTAVPAIFGLTAPDRFRELLRRFPRSDPWGYVLMLLGTIWFVYNVSLENVADFASYRKYLLTFFAGVGVASCLFVRDFLAVRGAAVVMLLLAKWMVDTGRPFLETTSWVVLWQAWAYVFVAFGIWFTVSPWRLRDMLHWLTDDDRRIRLSCGLRVGFSLLIILLGATAFRRGLADVP